MLRRIDVDGRGEIDKQEICCILEDERALEVMADLKIDVPHLFEVLIMHYETTEALSIRFIMQLMLNSQGDRHTTVEDLRSVDKFNRWAAGEKMKVQSAEITKIGRLLDLRMEWLYNGVMAIQKEMQCMSTSQGDVIQLPPTPASPRLNTDRTNTKLSI